jgi:hypothetical protein
MSINLMSAVFSASELTSTEKLVLLAMTDFANDDGLSIYPSIETLSKKTALAERTIQRVIQGLQERGIVEVIIQGNGRYHTNEYRIYKGKLKLEKGDTATRKGDRQYTKGDRVSSKGDPTSIKGVTESPDPSLTIIDPPIKSSVEAGQNRIGQSRVIALISAAAGLVAIPSSEMARTEQIESLYDFYGYDKCLEAFKWAALKWKMTKGKTGIPYRITNMGWVDWAQDKLMEDNDTTPKKGKAGKQMIKLADGQIVEVS